jgi:hypothetical protein
LPHLQRVVALETDSLQALRPHVLPIVKIVGGPRRAPAQRGNASDARELNHLGPFVDVSAMNLCSA